MAFGPVKTPTCRSRNISIVKLHRIEPLGGGMKFRLFHCDPLGLVMSSRLQRRQTGRVISRIITPIGSPSSPQRPRRPSLLVKPRHEIASDHGNLVKLDADNIWVTLAFGRPLPAVRAGQDRSISAGQN